MVNKEVKIITGVITLLLVLALALIFIFYNTSNNIIFKPFERVRNIIQNQDTNLIKSEIKLNKFKSEQEFKAYLAKIDSNLQYQIYNSGIKAMASPDMIDTDQSVMMKSNKELRADISSDANRVSDTNVQVLGIDEPDIIKTDGENIYYNSNQYYYGYRSFSKFDKRSSSLKIIKAFPPSKLQEIANIDKSGDLFLDGNILIILSGQKIYAYDVSNTKSPQEKWRFTLNDNNYLVEARLYNGELYLVTRSSLNAYHPCPIRPFAKDSNDLKIACSNIYYPDVPTETDSTFIVLKINTRSGKVKDTMSFLGSNNSAVVYMSANYLYLTYFYTASPIKFFYNFLIEKCSDLTPDWLSEKFAKLQEYDLSQQSKMSEMQYLLRKYYNSLEKDERLRIKNEFTNRMSTYHQEHIRELEKTGIVRVDLNTLKIKNIATVPGYPLNQFSLDEYEGDLRIATSIGERSRFYFGLAGGINNSNSVNDVYIFGSNLKLKGKIRDLGKGERIYSVRFIGERAYVVTFRQTDPFYVLDLSNPSQAEVKGKLKIPGYSSYLHPVSDDIILGIGKENNKVKLSLFDVSDPTNPQEVSKYMLDEYWSEAVNNHHAFLLDKKHKIFFIPGGKGSYVFSYDNNNLSLSKAISKTGIKRAVYINDYLYIIGREEISVFDENTWMEVNKLELETKNDIKNIY